VKLSNSLGGECVGRCKRGSRREEREEERKAGFRSVSERWPCQDIPTVQPLFKICIGKQELRDSLSVFF